MKSTSASVLALLFASSTSAIKLAGEADNTSLVQTEAQMELNRHRKHHNLSQHKRRARAKDMGERGYDPEVYGFAAEMVSAINGQERSEMPYAPNGIYGWDSFAERKHKQKHHQHRRPDIAERNMDEEVHGFVKEYTPPLNEWKKSDQAFIPNGSDPSAFDPSFAQHKRGHRYHKKPDIAERKTDEEIYNFVKEYTNPENEIAKTDKAFIPNGSDPSSQPSFSQHRRRHNSKHHRRPDIAERNMDEEVHGFVKEYTPPLNEWKKSDQAFIPNGSDPSAFDPSFAQHRRGHRYHKKPDIAERKTDEEIYNFVKEYTNPENEIAKTDKAFIPNGSDPSSQPSSFAQAHRKPDILDEPTWAFPSVQPFSSDALPPLSQQINSDYAWQPNGGANAYPAFAQVRKQPDIIAEPSWFDPKVQAFSSDNLPPLSEQYGSDYAWESNGYKNVRPGLAQIRHKPDILDEPTWAFPSVQPFSSDALPPLSQQINSDYAWQPNGGANAYPAFAQVRKQPDIIDEPKWFDPKVQGFSSDNLPPLSEQWGSDYEWSPNGSNPSSHVQKPPSGDIAERSMEDHFVHPFSADQDVVLPTPNPWTRPYLPYVSNGASNVYAQTQEKKKE